MNSNNYQYFKNKETLLIISLIFLSILARIPIILMYGDTNLDHEWKILLDNLVLNKTLSFRTFDEFLLPNLIMPPLYAFYLYIFSFFT